MAGSEEGHQTKVKQYHGRNNVVAWQEYQSAHKARPTSTQYPAQKTNKIRRMKTQ